ncbi:hypothetical protein, partial [Paraburkholderia sp. SIMBA_027]|uniref:hypothetical protein n=1 Tax=Paraburkholderia sp. SIMBA_027 TaxID=3085770 RepID=UPI00397809E9
MALLDSGPVSNRVQTGGLNDKRVEYLPSLEWRHHRRSQRQLLARVQPHAMSIRGLNLARLRSAARVKRCSALSVV